VLFFASVRARAADDTFFELKIRPILAEKCFPCHGGKKVSRNLRVDSRAALLPSSRRTRAGDGADEREALQALKRVIAQESRGARRPHLACAGQEGLRALFEASGDR